MIKRLLPLATLLLLAGVARPHDTWGQTNPNVVRPRDQVHVDLMLGNRGNDHRDFALASTVDLAPSALEVLAPVGKRDDLRDRLAASGTPRPRGTGPPGSRPLTQACTSSPTPTRR